MSMESESIMELLHKQEVSGRRSTEAEIVGADDTFPQCLLSRYSIEGQVFAV